MDIGLLLGIDIVFIRYGRSGNIIGVSLVHLVPTLPYMTLVMSGVYANYDVDYELQARKQVKLFADGDTVPVKFAPDKIWVLGPNSAEQSACSDSTG